MKQYLVLRLHAAYYRIGGVHQDIPKKVLEDIFNWSKKFGKVIEDIEDFLIIIEFSSKER